MSQTLCRAVLIPQEAPKLSGADILTIGNISKPSPKVGEALIRVHAAGINRPDILQRQGLYPSPKDASPILGLEVAGEIVDVGKGVDTAERGRKICALTNGGGYSEYCTVPIAQCLPIPDGLSMEEAASLPETFFTVWSNLVKRAHIQAGDSLLIHGGSSGIGTTAIQIAKILGAEVHVTVGNANKAQACMQLGADHAIIYHESNFVEAVRAHKNGKGVDVILDMVGGDYIQRNIDLLNEDGRLVSIAFLNGSKAEVNFMKVMLKRLHITGSTLRPRSTEFKAEIARELEARVWPHIVSGKIRTTVHKIFPFHEVKEAHRCMEDSQHVGKIVLNVMGS